MSPSRAPPGDAVSRGRDVVEAIQMSSDRKCAREKSELVQLLGLPHIQVCVSLYKFIHG
jgi:calcium/calmodulin-dependent serine protein kinase